MRRYRPIFSGILAIVLVVGGPLHGSAQTKQNPHDHDHGEAHVHKNYLHDSARTVLRGLMVQDFQGRMKPLDTLARESMMKITKLTSYEGWEPVDLYLSWMTNAEYWFGQPIIAVRHSDLKNFLGVRPETKRITPNSLLDESGRYRLAMELDKVHRTPDKERSKMQRKLISLDERVNVFNMAIRGISLRVFPVPGEENNRWISPAEFQSEANQTLRGDTLTEYQTAFRDLYDGLRSGDNDVILKGARAVAEIQAKYGAGVLPSERALGAEIQLNRLQPFTWVTLPYLAAFMLLMMAYAWSLVRRRGEPYPLRHPLYALGMFAYLVSLLYHLYGYVIRWIAGGHAPLSNGYESLIFISVMISVAGLYYEMKGRRGSMASLAALLTCIMLGVAMLPGFDPAISPLVPVLASVWLIIHVMVITASYGFLGLGALIAMTMLVLYLFKGPGRKQLRYAIIDLHTLHWKVLVTGLAFLSVGTFLGGVWANESWGRYWGWDPKETWSLVTILVYAFVVHLRFIDRFNTPLNIAAGSFLGIGSVGMTYFGVNYFLSGLHSYAQGDAPGVPGWVYVMAVSMIALVFAAFTADSSRSWQHPKGKKSAASSREAEVQPD